MNINSFLSSFTTSGGYLQRDHGGPSCARQNRALNRVVASFILFCLVLHVRPYIYGGHLFARLTLFESRHAAEAKGEKESV